MECDRAHENGQVSQRAAGFRQLLAASMCRPRYRPLFASSAPAETARSVRLMVWTDDEHATGDRLCVDVFPGNGITLELTARVSWVDPQPNQTPARFRLGLSVFAPREAVLDEVERLLAD